MRSTHPVTFFVVLCGTAFFARGQNAPNVYVVTDIDCPNSGDIIAGLKALSILVSDAGKLVRVLALGEAGAGIQLVGDEDTLTIHLGR